MAKLDQTKPTLKIIPVEIDTPFQTPDGFTMRDIHQTEAGGELRFFAVCIKMPPKPEPKPAPAPKQPPVNLDAKNMPKKPEKAPKK